MGRPPTLPDPNTPAQERVPPVLATRGACSDPHVGDIFFEETTYATAAEVCRDCPVSEVCRDYAIHNEPHGVWGGLTPDERLQRRGGSVLLRVEDRRLADDLRASLGAGVTHERVAERFHVNVRTIERWVAPHHSSGESAA